MPRTRRIQTWLAALLVLLQALWPSVHAYDHARQAARSVEAGVAQCSCGAVHRGSVERRDRGPSQVAPADRVLAAPHDCAICELLRGTREFHGAAPSPFLIRVGCIGNATFVVPEAPLGAVVPRPSLPRAPPSLLV